VIFDFASLSDFLAICSAKIEGGRSCSARSIYKIIERFLKSVTVYLENSALLAAFA
jgi:hypothetical protein